MKSNICDKLGMEFPLFAFTHCRDVVAAVSNAGGFGVLGAVGHTPESLEIELNWIDEHVDGKPYGVDLLIPNKIDAKGEMPTVSEVEARLIIGVEVGLIEDSKVVEPQLMWSKRKNKGIVNGFGRALERFCWS